MDIRTRLGAHQLIPRALKFVEKNKQCIQVNWKNDSAIDKKLWLLYSLTTVTESQ
jgi:hypothetical protein